MGIKTQSKDTSKKLETIPIQNLGLCKRCKSKNLSQ